VSAQVTVDCDVCRLVWMVVSTGVTSDCSIAYDLPATTSTTNVGVRDARKAGAAVTRGSPR
jgi:hypothetical protein